MTFSYEYFAKNYTKDLRSMQMNTVIVWKIKIEFKYRLHRLHSQKKQSNSLQGGILSETVAVVVILIIMCNVLAVMSFSCLTKLLTLAFKPKNCVQNGRFKRTKPRLNHSADICCQRVLYLTKRI